MMRSILCVGLFLSVSGSALAGDVEIRDAWIRQPPPGTNAAAYMTIHNSGERARKVIAVRGDVADRIEVHRTTVEEGVARMSRVDGVEVPAKGEVELAPRGLHLMLIKPKALKEGDAVKLTFELDGGEALAVAVSVRKQASDGAHDAHHH